MRLYKGFQNEMDRDRELEGEWGNLLGGEYKGKENGSTNNSLLL